MNGFRNPALHIIFIFSTFLSYSTIGQSFKLGVGGSIHAFSTHLADDEQKETFKTQWDLGYSPGFFTNIMFASDFSLQTEFYYTWQGRKLTTIETNWQHRARYQYIEIPVLLRKTFDVKLYKDITTRWYINAGPNIKYWARGKGDILTGANIPLEYKVVFGAPPDDAFPTEYMYLNNVNRLLFGLSAGLGFSIEVLKSNTLFFEMRYTQGQTYFGEKDSAQYNVLDFQDTMKANSRIITFTACYMMEFNYFKIVQKSNLKKHKKAPKPKKK